ncbi:hypothetical protein [Austwickia chelonae]|uniref:hypothetical protein n=1 Tax=Austwickia chelonae TaxID=100225 RepID=UPI000E253202|nr:hypothetical protein [Austwickia chelonae]
MRIPPSSHPQPNPREHAAATPPRPTLVPVTETPPQEATRRTHRVERGSQVEQRTERFSVLNDFRYLTDSDKRMLAEVTGERIEPGFTDRAGPASAFALQVALDRRTGQLAPQQEVTSVYLRNASEALERANEGRRGFTNPYSGQVFDQAISWLDAHGRARADIRL